MTINFQPDGPVRLPSLGSTPEQVHVFDDQVIWAVKAAMAANRPLLVRGEPGIGKTQLARAAAQVLRRPFVSHVVDSRTQSRDLLWRFDAVQRLAEAQILGSITQSIQETRQQLAIEKYLHPGPLWWAFDWNDAAQQANSIGAAVPDAPSSWRPGNGCVVLIDEIDKAESDVPNGLLEALGAGSFRPEGKDDSVMIQGDPPLVVITTNEERMLPDAFVRRCLVLHLKLPLNASDLKTLLISRAQAHFDDMSDVIMKEAAEMLLRDREAAHAAQITPLPGQAEYLDLLRALRELGKEGLDEQRRVMQHVQQFVLKKSSGRIE